MPNPTPISIPEGPKSDCITKEVQDLLLDDAIEQVLPNRYSKLVFYSNVFTVPKPGTTLLRPVLDLKRDKNLPSMLKKGYYMVKLDIKKAYLHVLVDPQFRDPFRFIWKGAHYRRKTMPFGLSTAPRIFTMLLRPVLRMLRDINVSVIAYLDDLLIVTPTKEECLTNLKKTMDLLLKLGFKLNPEKSILEPTQSITFLGLEIDSLSMKLLVPKEKKKSVIKEIRNFLKLDQCSPPKLAGLKGKLIALKDAIIPFRLYTSQTNKFHTKCPTLANGDWDQSFPVPQEVKSEISIWLTVLNQWNGKEISLFPNFDYVLTTDASESSAGAIPREYNHKNLVTPMVIRPIHHVIKPSGDARFIIGLSSNVPKTKQLQTQNSNGQHHHSLLHQSPRWSNSGFIDSLRTTLETTSQEEDHSNWRTHSGFPQCESRSPQSSFRNESQVSQKDQKLRLAIEEVFNSNGLIRITPKPSDHQLLDHKDECPPTRLESMETMSSVSTTNTTAFGIGEDEFLKLDAYVDITDIPDLEITNVVSNDFLVTKFSNFPTYSALLHKTLVLCKMFGLERSLDLVKWSLKNPIVSTDSIKGPVINPKEQRNGNNNSNLPILELTGNSVFIQNNGDPLSTKEINEIVVSTLSKSGIDISKFKSHSTRSGMASLLLSNNIPFHVVEKMGRWKSNDTVDTFYDKKIIGEIEW
ncbi:hypothetical protein ACTA71_009065 [Dictyostelium dimigraforme]